MNNFIPNISKVNDSILSQFKNPDDENCYALLSISPSLPVEEPADTPVIEEEEFDLQKPREKETPLPVQEEIKEDNNKEDIPVNTVNPVIPVKENKVISPVETKYYSKYPSFWRW